MKSPAANIQHAPVYTRGQLLRRWPGIRGVQSCFKPHVLSLLSWLVCIVAVSKVFSCHPSPEGWDKADGEEGIALFLTVFLIFLVNYVRFWNTPPSWKAGLGYQHFRRALSSVCSIFGVGWNANDLAYYIFF